MSATPKSSPKNTPNVRYSGPRRLYVVTPVVLFAVAGGGLLGARARVPDNEIAPGVQVGSLKLGGKTVDEARSLLQQWSDARQATELQLRFAEDAHVAKTWTIAARKLKLGFDIPATLDDVTKAGREGMLAQMSHALTGSKIIQVPARVAIDDNQVRAYIRQIAAKVNRKPRNARLKLEGTAIASYVHDRSGLGVDVDASASAVTQAWTRFNGVAASVEPAAGNGVQDTEEKKRRKEDEKTDTTPAVDPNAHQKPVGGNGSVAAPVAPKQDTTEPPKETTSARPLPTPDASMESAGPIDVELTARATPASVTYEDVKQINGVLGKMQTDIGGTSNRHSNVALAASRINGTLLRPGEVFSYNKIVGPRTLECGFKTAPEIVKGVLKPGVGGGICQVSSTLYNAALLSNMKIVERSHHAFPVHYLPAGRDATVVDGDLDFKFTNSTDAPIYIYGKGQNGSLNFRIYGKKTPGREVALVLGKRSEGDFGSETERDSSMPAGHTEVKVQGHPRIDVTWYRVVKENGQEVKRDPIVTHYRAIPSVVLVGTAPPKAKPASSVPGTAKNSAKPVLPPGASSPAADDGAGAVPNQ